MTRLEWLLERQRGIGSSDAPNLVGVGFGDASSVYRSKIETPDPNPPKTGILARGTALEGIVATRYADEMGEDLILPQPIVRHPVRAWQSASPDRMRRDGRYVEMKTVIGFGDEWGLVGSDRVPDGYAVQVQHQMGVLEVDSIDLATLDVINWEFRCYRIAFDVSFFSWLTEVEHEFVCKHLEPRVPPPAEWEDRFHETATIALKKEKRIELGRDAVSLIERRKELGAIRDEADDEYRRLGSRIEAMMGDAEIATAGAWKVKRIAIAAGEYTAVRKAYMRLDIRAVKEKK